MKQNFPCGELTDFSELKSSPTSLELLVRVIYDSNNIDFYVRYILWGIFNYPHFEIEIN